MEIVNWLSLGFFVLTTPVFVATYDGQYKDR